MRMIGMQARRDRSICHWQCMAPAWRDAKVKNFKKKDRRQWRERAEKEYS